MENKKGNLLKVFLVIAVILIVVMGALLYMQKIQSDKQIAELEDNKSEMKEKIDDLQGKIDGVSNIVNDNSNGNTQAEENIILYKGIEIAKTTGTQTVADMEINAEAIKKYNTT